METPITKVVRNQLIHISFTVFLFASRLHVSLYLQRLLAACVCMRVHVCRQRRCHRHHRCLTSHFTSFVPRHLTVIFKTPLQVLYRGCGRLQLQDVPDDAEFDVGQFHCWSFGLGREFARWTWLGGGFKYLWFSPLPAEMIQFDQLDDGVDQDCYCKVVREWPATGPLFFPIDACSVRHFDRMRFYIRRTCLWIYLGDSWTQDKLAKGGMVVTWCPGNWFHHVTLTHAQCDLVIFSTSMIMYDLVGILEVSIQRVMFFNHCRLTVLPRHLVKILYFYLGCRPYGNPD